MDDHNNNRQTKDDVKNETGDDGQQQGHTNAPPLIHPCVVVASHSIFSKLDTCFPYVRSSETSPQPVLNQLRLRLVETGLSTNEN